MLSGNTKYGVPAILARADAASASPQRIREAIREAYEKMRDDYPDDGVNYGAMADAVNRFLIDQGVP